MPSVVATLLGLMPIFNVDTSDPYAANFTSDLTQPILHELESFYQPTLVVNLTGLGQVEGVRIVMPNQDVLSKSDIGLEYVTLERNIYEAFYAVPYAEPPVRKLSFANPVPVKPWNTLLHNLRPSIACAHLEKMGHSEVTGIEDCLYLNIYRPFNAARRLPVMVYIHGGENVRVPANIMNPESLMITGRVVLVYISFRLGPFGFLTTSDKVMPGNFGLKDQRLALKFIKEHIEHFGGDPNKITIFGHGSGAVACQLHMLNEISSKYFTQGIIMSGSAIAPYTRPTNHTYKQAQKLLKRMLKLGTKINDMKSEDVIKELRKTVVHIILDWKLSEKKKTHFDYEFRYVIEDDDVEDAFIKRPPRDRMTEENVKDMPVMFTYVAGEGALMTNQMVKSGSAIKKFDKKAMSELQKMTGLPESTVKKVTTWYLKQHKFQQDNLKLFVEIFSDFEYIFPMYYSINSHFKNQPRTKQPVFVLKIDYNTSVDPFFPNDKLFNHGLQHTADTFFIFSNATSYVQEFGHGPVVRALLNQLLNFAEQNFQQLQECRRSKWWDGSFTRTCDYTLLVGSETMKNFSVQTTRSFDCEKMALWFSVHNSGF